MMNRTFSEISVKVAATVIAAIILGLGGVSYAFISDKVDNETFQAHCRENEEKFKSLQTQVESQVKINTALLEALNRLEVKVTKVETNTEWLINERKK